jgi:Pectate lyase superfamily protein
LGYFTATLKNADVASPREASLEEVIVNRRWIFGLCTVIVLGACNAPTTISTPLPRNTTVKPTPPTAPTIPSRSFRVADYGAIPDDGTDDTAAIQKAIDAISSAGGGSLLFPPGRFDISIQRTGSHPQALRVKSKLRLAPSDPTKGATLRLADGQGNYESVLATAEYGESLEDFVLEGLTIDGNGPNNPVPRAAGSDPCCDNSPDFGSGATQTPRYALRAYVGARVKVDGVRFLNQANVNVISFNGPDMTDADIVNSSFEGVGNEPADYDHSSIYTNGPRMRVANNRFSSRNGPGTKGARTAIETHDVDQIVTGNVISGFTYGVNVVAEGTAGGKRQLYADNTLEGVGAGFVIWSYLGTHTVTDATLEDVEIRGNTIKLETDAWRAAKLSFDVTAVSGVTLEANNEAPIDRLIIADNRIEFLPTSSTLSSFYEQRSAGVTLWLYKNPTLPIRGLSITNNTVLNAIGPGIYSSVPVSSDRDSVIEGNTFVNPARGNELRYPDAALFRSGIYIEGPSKKLTVRNNTAQETSSPAKLAFGVAADGACELECALEGNTAPAGVTPLKTGPGWVVR